MEGAPASGPEPEAGPAIGSELPQPPYPRFSADELRWRGDRVRALMRERGVEALLVAGGAGSASVHYLTNYRPYSPAWVILPAEGEPTILHHFHNHNACARAMTPIADVRWYGPSAPNAVAACLKERGLDRSPLGVVGLSDAIPHATFLALQAELPGARFVDLGGPFRRLCWLRSGEELDWLRRSAALGDMACRALADHLRPGMTEREAVALVHRRCIPAGGMVSLLFVASTPMEAPRRPVPWQYPTDRVLQPGDVWITELTVDYWTYGAQLHRPFAVGAPPTPLYRSLFDAALACYERILTVLRPGVTSAEIVAAASVIEERGFTSVDSVFHGEAGKNPELGTPSAVHPCEDFAFEAGMVFVVQPNPVTRDGRAGLQLGATVHLGAHGAEPLHRFPLQFTVCR